MKKESEKRKKCGEMKTKPRVRCGTKSEHSLAPASHLSSLPKKNSAADTVFERKNEREVK